MNSELKVGKTVYILNFSFGGCNCEVKKSRIKEIYNQYFRCGNENFIINENTYFSVSAYTSVCYAVLRKKDIDVLIKTMQTVDSIQKLISKNDVYSIPLEKLEKAFELLKNEPINLRYERG